MTLAEARRLLFELAGLVDDGTVLLKKAYRRAVRLHHPDLNPGSDGESFKLLERVATRLRQADQL
ncbi:hypothetical protein [Streptomyces chrestomyceticus]|uniref:hypothetical protein n=1 Tax=Streptomyces chrestomyceticus TaxID=68185 RepID=UPI00340AA2A0